MSYSNEWDKKYRENTHMSIWPWSDVVSYVMRYSRPKEPGMKVLEIGCGAGANIPFFINLKADYYAIDGSATVIKMLSDSFPQLKGKLTVADFTKEIPLAETFELVIDRASLTHNDTGSITRCIENIKNKMAAGAMYIGVDWFSTKHSDFRKGIFCEDQYTKTQISEGSFDGVGRVHFSDESHIRELFKDFNIIKMEEKVTRSFEPDDGHIFSAWNFCAVKR